MIDPYRVIIRPVVTEKSHHLSHDVKSNKKDERINAYTFEVEKSANKFQIRTAIERLFEVRVVKVNTAIVEGKMRRLGRDKKMTEGRTKTWKKAVVFLAPENTIALY